MRRSFKYRLYPNKAQVKFLEETLETHRHLYNEMLAWRIFAWEVWQTSLSFFDQRRWFIHHWRNHSFYSKLNSNSAHDTILRLEMAFQNFFAGIKEGKPGGFPRFQKKGEFHSIWFATYPNGLKLLGSKIRVGQAGFIRVKLHRPILGKIKTAALTVQAGKWYVVFSCDLGKVEIPVNTKPAVGIDMGLEHFLTTSDSEHIANPRFLKEELPKLKRVQRSLSRKSKGGSNRQKVCKQVEKLHQRIKCVRKEFHYQTALGLVRQYGTICVEKLNVRGMMQNRHLSRAISDAGWSQFLIILKHKCEEYGVRFIEVDPRGTSQLCSQCNQEVKKELSERLHQCENCGLELHRDHNAAINILNRGLQAWSGPAGANVAGCRKRSPRRTISSFSSTSRKSLEQVAV